MYFRKKEESFLSRSGRERGLITSYDYEENMFYLSIMLDEMRIFLGESVDYENILTFFTTSTFCFSWFASSFIFTARCSWTSFARNLKIINFCKFLIVLFDIKRRGEKKCCLFQRFFFEKTSSFSYLETILCEFFPTYSSFYHWKLTLE